MGKLKRFSTFAALAAVSGVVATGCGGDDNAAPANGAAAAGQGDETIRVAFLSSIANTFTQAVHEGFNAAAKGTGVEVKMFDTGTDPQKQYNTFTDIISQKQFDGIAVLPIDAASLVPAVENAIAADIKVVSFNNPLGPKFDTLEPQVEGQTNVVMDASQFQRGVWMGEMAVDACEGIDPCEVSWLSGLAGIAGEQALVDGFKKGISTAPSVKLATVRAAGGYTPEVTGKVKLIGLGGSEIAINGIKAGTWYGGVVTLPYDVGVASFEALVEGVKTGKAGTGVNVTDKTGIDPKITKDNADSFKPQWKG
jgi:ribose transport system substrate-binding protein